LNTVESAQVIMSELIPLEAVTMQIQHELEAGMTLGNTSAGTVLTAEMREMQKKHEKELAGLKREMEEAAKANDLALRAELAEERRALEQKMARAKKIGKGWRGPSIKLVRIWQPSKINYMRYGSGPTSNLQL